MPAIVSNPLATSVRRSGLAVAPQTPLLRVTRNNKSQLMPLAKGKPGSLATAALMAQLVREDTVRDLGLQSWAAQLLVNAGLDSHSPKADIAAAILSYVQRLQYIHDPAGAFESIQNARTTIKRGFGDCDDLSIVLATLLAQVGLRPRFVLARYKQATKGYDHVYVDIELPPEQGGRLALDPSSRRAAGWESLRAVERVAYPIFSGPVSTLRGTTTSLATTGAAVGLSFIPGVGPFLSALAGPVASLFDRTQQRTEEATRDTYRDQVYAGLDDIRRAVESCQLTPEQGTAEARRLIDQMYSACDMFSKSSVAKSCRNFETQDYPGGAQEGAFKTRAQSIASAGGNCGSKASGQRGTGASSNATASGSASNLLPLALIALGAYFVLR